MNYSLETKQQFILLRAHEVSLSKISEQLNVPKSTLGVWNLEHEAEINRLKRVEWEELEADFKYSLTDDLKRLMVRIRRLEMELDDRHPSYFRPRELMVLIRETRREYDRRRALLLTTSRPERNHSRGDNGRQDPAPPTTPEPTETASDSAPPELDETGRPTENRPTRPRNTNDLQQFAPEPSNSGTAAPAARSTCVVTGEGAVATSGPQTAEEHAHALGDSSAEGRRERSSAKAKSPAEAGPSARAAHESLGQGEGQTGTVQNAETQDTRPSPQDSEPASAPPRLCGSNHPDELEPDGFLGSIVINPLESAQAIILKSLQAGGALQLHHNQDG